MGKDKFPWDKKRDWGAIRRDNTYYNKHGFHYEVKRLAANVIKQAYESYTTRRSRRNPLFEYSYADFVKYGIEERLK